MKETTMQPQYGITATVEVAGLRTQRIRFREGTKFSLFSRGPALAEVYVNDSFALMYRRKDSKGSVQDRMFWVTDKDYEMQEMSHKELLDAVNKLADVAD